MGVKFDIAEMADNLLEASIKLDIAVEMFAKQGAQKMENSAKKNAKWQDRTGSARQRLNGYTQRISNGQRIVLAHGVDYGVWLELAHEKKYSIIPSTISTVGQKEVMPAFKTLMGRLR